MSRRQKSFDRLRAGAWTAKAHIAAANDASCKFQSLSSGNGTYVYDEYSVIISKMPSNLTAEAYLMEIARDPNGAVNQGLFNNINMFTKRTKTDPKVGDLYDIDIIGPDNGSIVLVALSPGFGISSGDSWFDIQTVTCNKYGSHPESGAREFGMEYVPEGIKYYTRGVSSPNNVVVGAAGKLPQITGWVAMLAGISGTVRRRGGIPKANSAKWGKYTKTN